MHTKLGFLDTFELALFKVCELKFVIIVLVVSEELIKDDIIRNISCRNC